jgi:ribosome biogenesis GTPase A
MPLPIETSPPPRSYFQHFQRLDTSATPIDIDDSFGTELGFQNSIDQQNQGKDLMALQSKAIKLGKHKTKQRVDNTQHISKSLSLAMKTGRLPTLIQQVETPMRFDFEEFENNTVDDIPFIPQNKKQQFQSLLPSDSLLGNDNQEGGDIYDDDWTKSYNSLVSTGIEDLSIKETSAVIKHGDYAVSHGDPYNRDMYTGSSKHSPLSNDGKSKSQSLTGFKDSSIYSISNAQIAPRDTDIAAAATAANWFPGHMKKALEDMADKIKHVPLSIEVRDARLPLSSANPLLDSLTGNKTKIIVLNKTDLVKKNEDALKLLAESHGLNYRNMLLDKTIHPMIMQTKPKQTQTTFDKMVNSHGATNEQSPIDIWINSLLRTHSDLSSLPRALIDVPHIISPDRKLAIILTNNNNLDTTKSLLTLIKALAPKRNFQSIPTSAILCGYPNVGKSTLINNLKISARMTLGRDGLEQGKWSLGTVANTVSKARAKIGPLPGVTRQVQGFKVSNNPPIVILDSPGIMVPRFDRSPAGINTSYKLALVQCISDVIADPKVQCEHLLKILNDAPTSEQIYRRYYEIPLFAKITNLQILSHFILKKEEIEVQSTQQWRDSSMKIQFGKVLSTKDYQGLIHRSRLREKELNVHMGAILNRYEAVKKINVNMLDFSSKYQFPSLDELAFEISPELEELAVRSFLKTFRTGKLGRFMME